MSVVWPSGNSAHPCGAEMRHQSFQSALTIAERNPILYALESDWPVGAAGFEPLHSGIEIRRDSKLCISKSDLSELHPASTGFGVDPGAPLIRDAQVRVPPPG